jgi:hypothetical protein
VGTAMAIFRRGSSSVSDSLLRRFSRIGGIMSKLLIFRSKIFYAAHFCLFFIIAICSAQESNAMGEVRFEGATKVEKDSGVWVDGDYVGRRLNSTDTRI